jgi:hypothetical protein
VEAQVAIGVMSHPDREAWVRELIQRGLADTVVTDHHGWGENVTGNMTWQLLAQTGAEWAIVLQDDALPVQNFREHATEALASVSIFAGAVSFYVGTSRPISVQAGLAEAMAHADENLIPWLYSERMLWGVAVAMRVADIPSYLEYSELHPNELYDTRIGNWVVTSRGKSVWYTHPSLVDHRDGPSLLHAHSTELPRHAHRVGLPEGGWGGGCIRIPPFPTRA